MSSHGPLRIYRDGEPAHVGLPYRPDGNEAPLLAARELLRSPVIRPKHRELEPFSRSWFEELELKRYSPPGEWLRRGLEFSRHSGETLLMLGPGIGSDAIQYHRHGIELTLAVGPQDRPELIRRNLALRGLGVPFVSLSGDSLPFRQGTFDLAYLNLFHTPFSTPDICAAELYRVLKPGGKLFVLAPAYYDIRYWGRILPRFRWTANPITDQIEEISYSSRQLSRLFQQYENRKIVKRHLRRSELPYLLRATPTTILERLIGRALLLRAFKPVTAAFEQLHFEPAA